MNQVQKEKSGTSFKLNIPKYCLQNTRNTKKITKNKVKTERTACNKMSDIIEGLM